MENFKINDNDIRPFPITDLKIQKNYLDLMPRPSEEDYNRLKDRIKRQGINSALPIVVNEDMVVLDGHTRLQIAKEFGLEWVYGTVLDLEDHLAEKEFIIYANLDRRQLTTYQIAQKGKELLEIEQERARGRQRLAGDRNLKQNKNNLENAGDSNTSPVVVNSQQPGEDEPGRALEKVANKIGIGSQTLYRIQKINQAAETDPKIAAAHEKGLRGEATVNQVYQQVKEKENQTGEPKQRPKVVFAKIKTWKEEREEYRKKREERGLKYQVPREELVETFREAAKLKQMPMDAVEALMESDPEFLQVWKKMRLGMVTLTVGWCVIYWKIHVWFRSRQGLEPSQEFHRRIVLDMKKSYLVLLMKVAMQLRQNFNVSDVAVEFVTGIDRKLFPYIEAWEDRLDLLAENIQIRPRFRPEVVEKAHKLLSEGKKDECRNFVTMSAMGDFRKKLDKEMELERQSFGRS